MHRVAYSINNWKWCSTHWQVKSISWQPFCLGMAKSSHEGSSTIDAQNKLEPPNVVNKRVMTRRSLTLNFLRRHFSAYEWLLKAHSSKRTVLERSHYSRYHCVPHEINLAIALIPFQYKKLVVHNKTLKSRMNPIFPLFIIQYYT